MSFVGTLIRESFAGPHHADLVIGEGEMAIGQRHFGHVAARAVVLRHRADLGMDRVGC